MIAGMTNEELRRRLERIADRVSLIGGNPWDGEPDQDVAAVVSELRELAFEVTLSSPLVPTQLATTE